VVIHGSSKRVQWQFVARDEGDLVSDKQSAPDAGRRMSTEPGLSHWDADLGELLS